MKYLYEIILTVSVLILGYAIYAWFQIENFEWDKHNSEVYFIVLGALLVISNGINYWNVKTKRAQNQSEER
ncbi:MAG: hypothetical protein WBG42_16840 [Cryomorphaceae bacterium]